MPFRTECCDGVIEAGTDVTTHRHDYCLAWLGLGPLLVVGDQVYCHLLEARFSTHQCLQSRPTTLCSLSGRDVVLIGEKVVHLVVNGGQDVFLERQLRQSGLVVDRHGGTVFHCLLDVVDGDVVTEDCLGITVVLGDGRPCKGKEGCLWQSIPKCLRQSVFDLSCLGVEAPLKPVLGSMCLVTDHHDVVAVAQGGELVFSVLGGELLDRGEDDPAARSVVE